MYSQAQMQATTDGKGKQAVWSGEAGSTLHCFDQNVRAPFDFSFKQLVEIN